MKESAYKKSVNIIGWIIFCLTSSLYLLTMYPTTAFWDCGEFISSACLLNVNHQPGAPLYQILGSLINILSFGNVKLSAILINGFSAVCSGLSIMLLYRLFLYLFNKYSDKPIGNTAAAVISSLTFALTDSFWTCSTEAEVYSLSFLFTILALWTVIRWDENPSERYIVLLSFIFGLSYAIHPLTLLSIPACVFIIFFHYKKITLKGIIFAVIISVSALILYINAFSWILGLLNLSFSLTVILSVVILAGLLGFSVIKHNPVIHSAVFCVLFFFLGCSLYFIVAIRSNQNIPSNQYPAYTAKTLNNYISRQSYIHPPLLYGAYYTGVNSLDFKIENNKIEPVFPVEQKTFFPRMWNYTQPSYEDGYCSWVGSPEQIVVINGEEQPKPSFRQNAEFFFKYQLGYMYFRYLLWNFSGKTDDMQGMGDLTHGWWQTGYIYTDKLLDIDEGSTYLSRQNKGNNRYFAIPLILCLIGVFYHIIKDSKRFLFVGTIFIMYSLALVVYTNMPAYEPRERDYIFLPSYMAVSIWIGIGILGISQIIANIIKVRKPRYILPIFLIVPVWMFIQNIDDHNHHGQYTAHNFAFSILNSCKPDAILFTDGDNDTYPLWYLQNVEHIRRDVKVINRQLLNNAYYIKQQTQPMPECRKINLSFTEKDYADGIMDQVQIIPGFDTSEISKAVNFVKNYNNNDPKFGNHIKLLNTNTLKFSRNGKDAVFKINDAELSKSDMIILDIIASNKDREIYFSSYSNENFIGLDDHLLLEGFAYRLVNKKVKQTEDYVIDLKAGMIDANTMYNNVMHGFKFDNFDRNIYFNDTERSFVNFYLENISALAYVLLQQGQDAKAMSLVNKTLEAFPVSIHHYPYSLADLAVVAYASGNTEKAMDMMNTSLKSFSSFIKRYNTASVRFQAQNRLEAEKNITYFLNLCVLCENWGLEELRIVISEAFFDVIRPYMEISYRQKNTMTANENWYKEEIERMDSLIEKIKEFASHYEEELPQENLQQ